MTVRAIPYSHTSIKFDRLSLLFFLMLFLMVSRGAFELILPKKLAMMLQFGGLTGLCLTCLAPSPFIISSKQRVLFILILLFILESLLSSALTYSLNHRLIWVVYTTFNFGLLAIAITAVRDFKPKELARHAPLVFLLVGWMLLLIGFCEQAKLIKLVGSGKMYVIRPASLTGSFLHYPILMALIGYLCIQWYAISRKTLYFLSGALFCLSTITSFSRSGALIVFAAIFFYPFTAPFKKSKKILFLQFIFIGFLIFAFVGFAKESRHQSVLHNMVHRVVSSANTKSIGNNVRVEIWSRVASEWLGSNLLIGEQTGEYTNSSNNLRAKKTMDLNRSKVTESSLLQLLLNFGFLGMVLFYAILFQVMRFIEPDHYWIKAAFLGAIAQTLVYQSIEVVPFIVLLFFFPWISQSMNRAKQT